MKAKLNIKKVTDGGVKTMAIGVGSSLAAMLFLTAICAVIICRGIVSEENQKYCVVAILVISSAVGTRVMEGKGIEGLLPYSMICAVIYVVTLLSINAVIFGSGYQGVVVSAIVVLSGGFLPILTGKKGRKKSKSRRSKRSCC